MKKLIVLLLGIVLVLTTACSGGVSDEREQGDKPLVYATVFPVYALAEEVAGDLVELKMVLPEGVDAHDFEPSAKLIAEISSSKLLLMNGLEMEHWLDGAEQAFAEKGLTTVEVSAKIEPIVIGDEEQHEKDHDHESEKNHSHHHGQYDPHIWQSPANAKIMVENIYYALDKLLKDEQRAELKQNFERTITKLDDLEQRYQRELKDIPCNKLIVGHAAFAYLCRDFGLEQVAVAGLSTLDEPSVSAMAEIVDIAKENDVKTVFYDSFASDKLARVIADETGIELKPLHTLGMRSEAESTKTYFDLMEENLEILKSALK